MASSKPNSQLSGRNIPIVVPTPNAMVTTKSDIKGNLQPNAAPYTALNATTTISISWKLDTLLNALLNTLYEVAFKRGCSGTAGEPGAGSRGEKSAIFDCNLVLSNPTTSATTNAVSNATPNIAPNALSNKER
jgi:hypothetical protein